LQSSNLLFHAIHQSKGEKLLTCNGYGGEGGGGGGKGRGKARGSNCNSNTDCEAERMKDFTIGQVRNGVIEHGDNYYGSRTDQVGFDQSPAKRR